MVAATKDTEVDYEFVAMEDTVSYMPVEDLIRMLFTPFKAEFRSRVEQYEGQPQFIYEVADPNYEKPIILRNMPYLSNHLSGNEGIIGIYLDLNRCPHACDKNQVCGSYDGGRALEADDPWTPGPSPIPRTTCARPLPSSVSIKRVS